jgi:hypothetical protein
MLFLDHRWPPHSYLFLGGGGGQSQAIQSAPVPLPAPPVTPNNATVMQAEHDVSQANLLKKSVKKTIFAGDTGGFNPQAQPGITAKPKI